VIPPFEVIGYTAVNQHRHAAAHAEGDARRLVRQAARGEQARLIASTRALLTHSSQFPAVCLPHTSACPQALAHIQAAHLAASIRLVAIR
jgi:hypothetical protein